MMSVADPFRPVLTRLASPMPGVLADVTFRLTDYEVACH